MSKSGIVIEKIRDFLSGKYYLYALCAFALISSQTPFANIGMMLFAVVVGAALFLTDDSKPFIAGVCIVIYCMNKNMFDNQMTSVMYGAFVIMPFVLAGMIFRLVQIIRDKRFSFGHMGIGILVAGGTAAIAGLFVNIKLWEFAARIGILAFGFLFYILAKNMTKGDIKDYIADLVIAIGLVVAAELLLYYVRSGDIWNIIDNKHIELGWGVSNNLGMVFVITLPMCLYLSVRRKCSYIYVLLLLIFYVALLFTFSRGNLLFGTLLLVPMLIYTYMRTPHRKQLLFVLGGALMALLIMIALDFGMFMRIFGKMFDLGLSDNGRFPLYERALKMFTDNPILGSGYLFDGKMFLGHNTILQLLGTGGIVGIIGAMPFYYGRYVRLFEKVSMFRIFAFCAVLLFDLYGLMDLTYQTLYLVFVMFALSVAVEFDCGEGKDKAFLGRKAVYA